jgi:hypothetical protein
MSTVPPLAEIEEIARLAGTDVRTAQTTVIRLASGEPPPAVKVALELQRRGYLSGPGALPTPRK